MKYILIGKILNTFGLKGDLKCEVYTDFPEERFAEDSMIYLSERYLPFTVKEYRYHKGNMLLVLKDHEDINLVERYKGMNIYKAEEDIEPLEEGEYFFRDIIGLDAYVEEDKTGKVIVMEEGTPFNYMRILKDSDQKEYLVPFSPVFVKEVDLEKKLVRIIRMEGLL